jgi:hypothetical protein
MAVARQAIVEGVHGVDIDLEDLDADELDQYIFMDSYIRTVYAYIK